MSESKKTKKDTTGEKDSIAKESTLSDSTSLKKRFGDDIDLKENTH